MAQGPVKRSMLADLPSIRRDLIAIHEGALEVRADLDEKSDGHRLFSTDYGMFHGYMWDHTSLLSRAHTYSVRSQHEDPYYFQLNKISQSFVPAVKQSHEHMTGTILISIPSHYEYLNQLDMHLEGLQTSLTSLRNQDVYDRVRRFLDHGHLDDNFFAKGEDISNQAKDILRSISTTLTLPALTEYTALLSSGAAKSFGDFYDRKGYSQIASQAAEVSATVLAAIRKKRTRRIGEDLESFDFRNLIDATNIAWAYILRLTYPNQYVCFAGPLPPGLQDLRHITGEYRSPHGLLVGAKLAEYGQQKNNDTKERDDWLEIVIRKTEEVIKQAGSAHSISELTDIRRANITLYYNTIAGGLLMSTNHKGTFEAQLQGARELFSRKGVLEERIFNEEKKTTSAMSNLFEVEPMVDSDEVLQHLGLADNPRMKALRERRKYEKFEI